MRTSDLVRSAFVIAIASVAAACSGTVDGGAADGVGAFRIPPGPILDLNPAKEHSFLAPISFGTRFTYNDSWRGPDTPILFGRVNNDLMDDFIGFGDAGVYVGYAAGTKFSSVDFVLRQFGTQQGWRAARHVRLVGDINHDGLDDIVAFGDDGVWTALSTGSGFAPERYVLADLGYNQGWRVDQHVRTLADVNGDHNKDIVAFGDAGVYVAFADGAGGFGPMQFLVRDFGTQQGWSAARHVRTMVDLNGDGRDDLVAFGDAGVWTALSTGGGFAAQRLVLGEFGYNQSWRVDKHQRLFADVDADGRKDIVALGDAGVYNAHSNGDGTFGAPRFVYGDCGTTTAHKGCFVADMNSDGYVDLLAGGLQALGRPGGQLAAEQQVLNGMGGLHYAFADVDGNGMPDLIGFDYNDVRVARSNDRAPAPPPAMPSNVTVGNATSSSLEVHWLDNATNESGFAVLHYKADEDPEQDFVANEGANVNVSRFTQLDAAAKYCFRVRAFNAFASSDWTPVQCGRTTDATPPSSGTWSMWLNEVPPPPTGVVVYSGRWTPEGRRITRFTSAYNNGDRILFVKKNNDPNDCYSNPSAVLSLDSNGTLDATAVGQVSWPNSDGSISFYACLATVQPSQNVVPSLFFNIDWTY